MRPKETRHFAIHLHDTLILTFWV